MLVRLATDAAKTDTSFGMSRRRLKTIRDLFVFAVVAYAAFAAAAAAGSVNPIAEFLIVDSILVLVLVAIVFRWRLAQSYVEAELDLSEQRYKDIFEGAGDMVHTQDLEGRIVSINEAGERLLGYSRADAVGMNIADLLAPQYREWPAEVLAKHMAGESTVTTNVILVGKGGHHTSMEVSSQLALDDGKPIGIQCISRDTTERRRAERQLTHLANHDPLTNLFNRRRFEEELDLQLARSRRDHTESAVLFLDLDHFKDVNDSEGHRTGDQLLQKVGRSLREGLRDVDVVARLGGDEFTAMLVNTNAAEAQRSADKILKSLAQDSFEMGGRVFKITGSIGIAMLPRHGTSAAELLSAADLAMYQAKEKGRNAACLFPEQDDLQSQVSARVDWRMRISEALEEDRFRLYAQPILDLKTNTVTQHELLLRMLDQSGGVTEAGAFVETAERFGLIQAIDRWAVGQAIELLASCAKWNLDISLEVNISGKAFADDELLGILRRGFEETQANPEKLIIEVTETAAIEDMQRAQTFVSELKQIGCRFALDDFGAGFSSFHQLRQLDVDYLKIDGSFIKNLPGDPVGQHIVKAIVEMARALNKMTIAEYVTDDATLELVRQIGVDYAQGHAVGFPANAAQVVVADAILPPPVAAPPPVPPASEAA